jgi:hypothetical protein
MMLGSFPLLLLEQLVDPGAKRVVFRHQRRILLALEAELLARPAFLVPACLLGLREPVSEVVDLRASPLEFQVDPLFSICVLVLKRLGPFDSRPPLGLQTVKLFVAGQSILVLTTELFREALDPGLGRSQSLIAILNLLMEAVPRGNGVIEFRTYGVKLVLEWLALGRDSSSGLVEL